MATNEYDAIVVGARCSGAPTAMLLARTGYRVLLLDKDRFPSNMPQSTHLIHPLGVAYLKRWGLHDTLAAQSISFTRWRVALHGRVLDTDVPAAHEEPRPDLLLDNAVSYAPRRQLLDTVLVEAAIAAGAEFRDAARVSGLLIENGTVKGVKVKDRDGREQLERARIVVGADGPVSMVARKVGAAEFHVEPIIQSNIWSYWSGVPVDHLRIYVQPGAGGFAFPSSDGSVLVAANLLYEDFLAARRDRWSAYTSMLQRVAPELRAMIDDAEQVDDLYAGCTRAFVRQAYGPGWVLVGDAGMKKDPVTAQGITSAFEYAEKLAYALDAGLSGRISMEDALMGYAQERDARLLPYYEFTAQLSRYAAPTSELAAIYDRAEAIPQTARDLFGVIAMTVTPHAFFAKYGAAGSAVETD